MISLKNRTLSPVGLFSEFAREAAKPFAT